MPTSIYRRYTSTIAIPFALSSLRSREAPLQTPKMIIKKNSVRSLRYSCKNQNGLLSFGNRREFFWQKICCETHTFPESLCVPSADRWTNYLIGLSDETLWTIFLQEAHPAEIFIALYTLEEHRQRIIHLPRGAPLTYSRFIYHLLATKACGIYSLRALLSNETHSTVSQPIVGQSSG